MKEMRRNAGKMKGSLIAFQKRLRKAEASIAIRFSSNEANWMNRKCTRADSRDTAFVWQYRLIPEKIQCKNHGLIQLIPSANPYTGRMNADRKSQSWLHRLFFERNAMDVQMAAFLLQANALA